VGLQAPKLVIFGINFPKEVYPLKRLLQNLAWRDSQARTLVANLTIVTFTKVDQ